MDKALILNEIKRVYNIKSNAEFAKILGISPQNLSNWYKRGSYDVNLILRKFTNVNESWLLTGEGEMLKPANPFTRMPLEDIRATLRETIAEELLKLMKKGEIYLAATHDKIIAEKNEEIAKRDAVIDELRKENWELQRRLNEAK